MTDISLLDALIILFVSFRLSRAPKADLGESLHSLIALLLLIALFMGLQISSQVKNLLSNATEFFVAAPSLGSTLLIILATWWLMHLLRTRLGSTLKSLSPSRAKLPITFFSEGLRAALLAGFIVWLADGWIADNNPETSKSVLIVRAGNQFITSVFNLTKGHIQEDFDEIGEFLDE